MANPPDEKQRARRILRDGAVDEVIGFLQITEETLADGMNDEQVLEVELDWIRVQYLADMLADLESRLDSMKERGDDVTDVLNGARRIREELLGIIETIYE